MGKSRDKGFHQAKWGFHDETLGILPGGLKAPHHE
jgi:hypothetical protein